MLGVYNNKNDGYRACNRRVNIEDFSAAGELVQLQLFVTAGTCCISWLNNSNASWNVNSCDVCRNLD